MGAQPIGALHASGVTPGISAGLASSSAEGMSASMIVDGKILPDAPGVEGVAETTGRSISGTAMDAKGARLRGRK